MSALVRIWDRDWENPIESDDHGWRLDEPGIVTVPTDSETARWLLEQDDPAAWLTVDRDNHKRWQGRLDNYKVIRSDDDFAVTYLKIEFRSEVEWLKQWDTMKTSRL